MRRAGTILVSLVLSLVIVYLGAGTVIMHCLRSNAVTIGVKAGCCGDDGGCSNGGQCMETAVVKLQPTVLCKLLHHAPAPVFTLVPQFCLNGMNAVLTAISLPVAQYVPHISHAPPRLYLAIIRVLII